MGSNFLAIPTLRTMQLVTPSAISVLLFIHVHPMNLFQDVFQDVFDMFSSDETGRVAAPQNG
jgi:hypothetical protein